MDNFNIAMAFVSEHEGGWSDDSADRGGATMYGISLRFLKLIDEDVDGDGHVTAQDIRALSYDHALDLYRRHFWEHYRLDEINHPFIAAKAMDMFVNMRGRVAAQAIQACFDGLKTDGILGSQSLQAINDEPQPGGAYHDLGIKQAAVYHRIVRRDPSQARFIKGWYRRAAR